MQISMKNIRDFRQRRILWSGKASAESQAAAVTRTMWQPKHRLFAPTNLPSLPPHTRGNDQKSFAAAAFQTRKQVSISNVLLTNEIMMMRKIVENVSPHLNVIDLPDVYEDKNGVHLVLELCSGGELFDRNRIVKQERYCEAGAAAVVRQTAQGLAALHSSNIVHQDLKTEKCLFLNIANGSPLKIVDFVLCSVEEFTDPVVGLFGSIDRHQRLFLRDWSLLRETCGLLMYPPFISQSNQQKQQMTMPGEFSFYEKNWKGISLSAKQLISDLLKVDHDKRPSAQELGL